MRHQALGAALRLRPRWMQNLGIVLRRRSHVFHSAELKLRNDDLVVLRPRIWYAGFARKDVDSFRRFGKAAPCCLDRVGIGPVTDRHFTPRFVLEHRVLADNGGHEIGGRGFGEDPVPLDAVADSTRSGEAPVRERALALRAPDIEFPRRLVVRVIVGRNPEAGVLGLTLCPDDVSRLEVRSLRSVRAVVFDRDRYLLAGEKWV